jgi:Tol biopolymer transport system component
VVSRIPSPAGSTPQSGWIVYQGSDGLELVRPDGSAGHALLGDPAIHATHPDWSPDGESLVVVRPDSDGTVDIWTVDREGLHSRRLVDCQEPCTYAENPAWSPDGRRIAYWTQGPTATTQDIRVVDADTGTAILTVTAPEFQAPVNPRWSPDGGTLAVNVEHYVPAGDDVHRDGSALGIIDLTDAVPAIHLLTPFSLQASYPTWSPAGDRIMFMAGNSSPFDAPDEGPTNLFTVRPDGTGLVQLTHQRAGQPSLATPDWSADANLVFVTVIYGVHDYNLATIHSDGTRLKDLVDPATGIADKGGAHPRVSSTAP